jgi:tetratricopeptide (TPR) repeat protein
MRSASDPRFAVAYHSRGHAYQAKHEIDRAIADYDQAIRLQPNYAAALYWRGMAKRFKGGDAGGDADIAAAKKLNPNNGR